MSDINLKDAKFKATCKVRRGYNGSIESTISAKQWGQINKVVDINCVVLSEDEFNKINQAQNSLDELSDRIVKLSEKEESTIDQVGEIVMAHFGIL